MLVPDRFRAPDRDIKIIKEWMMKRPYLPHDAGDEFISQFIFAGKGSIEKAKQILDKYYFARQSIPDFFYNRDPTLKEDLDFYKIMYYIPTKTYTPGGQVLIFGGLTNPNPQFFNNTLVYRRVFMILDIALKEFQKINPIQEYVSILDHSGATLAHHADMSPAFVKKLAYSMMDAVPCRNKGIHIINAPPILEYSFNFLKSFLKKKVADRFFFHSKMDTLYDHVPKDLLPSEFGGKTQSLKSLQEEWKQIIVDHRDWFLKEEQRRLEEFQFRPKTQIFEEMSGTFRQLTID